jgi:lipoprotein signal peptidase
MKRPSSLSSASKLTVAALLVAALGFAIQIFSGIDVPTVPPGLVILVVAATVVALLPWRWVPVVGAFAGLFLFVGFIASGALGNLLDPSRFGVLVGAWIQFLALIVAVAGGLVATIQNYRKRL